MRCAHTILAFVIAWSVAMLPAAGSAIVGVKSTDTAMSADLAMSAEMHAAMDDCCPDRAKPCDQGSDGCQAMACCAVQAVGIASVAASQFEYPLVAGNPFPMLMDQAGPSHSGSPPFRPPRV